MSDFMFGFLVLAFSISGMGLAMWLAVTLTGFSLAQGINLFAIAGMGAFCCVLLICAAIFLR